MTAAPSEYGELAKWVRDWTTSGYWGPLGCPVQLPKVADALEAQAKRIGELEKELAGWHRYKSGIDEALNSGDGSYRP